MILPWSVADKPRKDLGEFNIEGLNKLFNIEGV